MKIFVSWSGDFSHAVAKALKDWLPNVIQAVEVFLSSEDIAKGSQWFHELGKVLDESSFGILCLTRQNLGAPWVLYEAGALGKHFGQARVVPLLIDLKMPDLEGPLAQFNAAELEKDEIAKLVSAINAHLQPAPLSAEKLKKAFKTWWPTLEKSLNQARADDLVALKQSHRFVLLYPQKLPTSALFEAGYALALDCDSHYFVRDRDDLPFLMRELAGVTQKVRIHTDTDWKDYDDLSEKMVRYKDKWFGK